MEGNNYVICKAKKLCSNNLVLNSSSFEKDITRHLMTTLLENKLVLFLLNFSPWDTYLINRDKTLIRCRMGLK